MEYIFIDTSNFVHSSLSSKGNHSPETLKELENILKDRNNDIILLIPEVVKLEYKKAVEKSFKNKIVNKTGELKSLLNQGLINYIQKSGLNNSLEENSILPKLNYAINNDNKMKHIKNEWPSYLKNPIESKIDQIREDRKIGKNKAKKTFDKIIDLDNSSLIDLTNEIIIKAEKRRIKEKAPSDGSHNNDQDCYIIESLLKEIKPNSILYFCCDNIKDFGDISKDNNEDSNYILHKDISEDFKKKNINIKYYKSLPNMLKDEFGSEISNEEIKITDELKEENQGATLDEMLITLNDLNKQYENTGNLFKEYIQYMKIKNYFKNNLTFSDVLFSFLLGLGDNNYDESNDQE